MGSCCCCWKKKGKGEVKIYKNENKEKSVDSGTKKLISEDKLADEQRQAFKAGESAYNRQKNTMKKNKIKSITDSQYNKKGLVDIQSKEFKSVRSFLKIKGYQLISSIGSGNYAEVYKAYNKQGKQVAVKVIQLKEVNPNYRQKFLPREIKILEECKHPNIIKIYEMCQYKNKVYIIMEFAENGTFADWLRIRGTLSESVAHKMFTKVLEAVHHMHSRRIAHRDLKLENILINAKMFPKISDFSFAIHVKPHVKSTTHCGSIPYFAPELLMKKPYNPLISDIWSLGVCFYIMLNDGLPFKLGDDKLMLKKQLTRDWKFKPKIEAQISPELKSMIKKMLEPDIKARITSAQLMKDPWIRNFADKN